MSNYIRADDSFELRHRHVSVPLPVILFVATDGCFGYLHTPAHFEELLLDTLDAAKDTADWKTRMRTRLEQVAADDVSLALVALGWKDFTELKKQFQNRLLKLKELLEPAEQVIAELRQVEDQLEHLRDRKDDLLSCKKAECLKVWNHYRPCYEERLRS